MKIRKIFFQYLFRLIFVLAITTVLGGHATNTQVKCKATERQALLEFKVASWNTSEEEDCCKWQGIKCSNLTGHVTALDLRYQRLSGEVSPSLLELKQLNYLDLSYNSFSHIPKFIGSLAQLRYLNLGYLHSRLPPQIGNLTKLQFLSLEGFGTIENLEWLPNLVSLKYLDLTFSNLENCNWLQPISKLSSLTKLYLQDCGLTGKSSLSLPLNNSSSMPPLSFIDLSRNYFNSSSSVDFLVNLTNSRSLVELYMADNDLGYVPEAIGHFVSLETLDLNSCEIHGEIPKSFRNLHHLRFLDLHYNALSGQLPDLFQTLQPAQKSLEYLNLNWNEFTGSLPDFTQFPLLSELLLYTNKLNGTFPESLGHISSLVHLELTENRMTGPLPDLAFLPSLRELRLGGNNLNGKIPQSLGQLSMLEIFEAYSNSFEGTISESHLANLSKLKVLDLSWNSLSFELNSSWTPPFQLEIIKLPFCKLGTLFPNWLQSQKNYSVLDISNAKISDTVPTWFWDLPKKLEYLNVSNNQINGQIGNLTSNDWVDFECLDLSSNRFHGSIPELPLTLNTLDLSKNMLTGGVPFICQNSLYFFDASDNLLSGKLPDCWTEGPVFINLANNNLSGEIPSSISKNSKLIFALQLRNNSFTGELPLSLLNSLFFRVIDLSFNKLSGKVPAWIAINLKDLIVLSLRGNKFHGDIPPEICQLTSLQILDLSQNSISGNLPTCVNNLSSMVVRNGNENNELNFMDFVSGRGSPKYVGHFVANVLVQWKRKDSEYKKTLGLLRCIDLSSNKLVGNIPPEFASLGELASLNLSKNNLSGNIFKSIGDMRMLESLDFSYNHLSGKIPTSLSNLSFLSVLDLSNNNLSGKIPQSTQLQTFDASAYTGNPKLCGTPLLIKCPGDEPTLVPPSIDDGKANILEDEDRFTSTGFYISVTLGFIVGFWGFCGPLLLKRRWRYAFFNKLMKIYNWVYVMAKVKKETLLRKLRR